MNFNLVVDTSNFKPFTYLEKIAPLLLYKDTLEKAQEKLEKYAEDYAGLVGLLPETSLYAETVLDLDSQLRSMSDEVARGINADTLKRATQLIYQGRLTLSPIKEMVKAYNNDIAFYNLIRASHPEAILPEADLINMDDYYGGKANLIKYINGDAVMKEAALATKAIVSQLKDDIAFSQSPTSLQFLEMFLRNPMSLEDIYRYATNPNLDVGTRRAAESLHARLLNEVYNGMYRSYNPNGSLSKKNSDKLQYYILMGAISGFPDASTKAVPDSDHETDYRNQSAMHYGRVGGSSHSGNGGRSTASANTGTGTDPKGKAPAPTAPKGKAVAPAAKPAAPAAPANGAENDMEAAPKGNTEEVTLTPQDFTSMRNKIRNNKECTYNGRQVQSVTSIGNGKYIVTYK